MWRVDQRNGEERIEELKLELSFLQHYRFDCEDVFVSDDGKFSRWREQGDDKWPASGRVFKIYSG